MVPGTGLILGKVSHKKYMLLSSSQVLEKLDAQLESGLFCFQREGKCKFTGLLKLDLNTIKSYPSYNGEIPASDGGDFAICLADLKAGEGPTENLKLEECKYSNVKNQNLNTVGYPVVYKKKKNYRQV